MPTEAPREMSGDELEAEFDRRMSEAEGRADATEAKLERRTADMEAEFDRRMTEAEAQAASTADPGPGEPRPEGFVGRFLGKLGRG